MEGTYISLFSNKIRRLAFEEKTKIVCIDILKIEEFYPSFFSFTHSVWKSPKMSHLNFTSLAFSTNFGSINTV